MDDKYTLPTFGKNSYVIEPFICAPKQYGGDVTVL